MIYRCKHLYSYEVTFLCCIVFLLFSVILIAVSNVATDVDLGLKEVQQLLEEETKSEEEFQVAMGFVATDKEGSLPRGF